MHLLTIQLYAGLNRQSFQLKGVNENYLNNFRTIRFNSVTCRITEHVIVENIRNELENLASFLRLNRIQTRFLLRVRLFNCSRALLIKLTNEVYMLRLQILKKHSILYLMTNICIKYSELAFLSECFYRSWNLLRHRQQMVKKQTLHSWDVKSLRVPLRVLIVFVLHK